MSALMARKLGSSAIFKRLVARVRLKTRFQGLFNRTFTRTTRFAYRLLSPIYNVFFGFTVDKKILCSRDVLSALPSLKHLDQNLNYFVLHASYGDKWLILSFLSAHFDLYSASRVIGDYADQALVEIFFSRELIGKNFIFVNRSDLQRINSLFAPKSKLSNQFVDFTELNTGLSSTPYLLKNGLPAGSLRSLHIVYYPYFMDLMNLHAVSYGTLLRAILYLPSSILPSKPGFYSKVHYDGVNSLMLCDSPNSLGFDNAIPSVLINAVNFSQVALSDVQLEQLALNAIAHGFSVFLNFSQGSYSTSTSNLVASLRNIKIISVPSDLLALACSKVDAVIGVLGGAMSVAAQFGSAHVLSLQSPANFMDDSHPDFLIYGGDKLWPWVHQDWPCLHDGRIIENKLIAHPSLLSDSELQSIINTFLSNVLSAKGRAYSASAKELR